MLTCTPAAHRMTSHDKGEAGTCSGYAAPNQRSWPRLDTLWPRQKTSPVAMHQRAPQPVISGLAHVECGCVESVSVSVRAGRLPVLCCPGSALPPPTTLLPTPFSANVDIGERLPPPYASGLALLPGAPTGNVPCITQPTCTIAVSPPHLAHMQRACGLGVCQRLAALVLRRLCPPSQLPHSPLSSQGKRGNVGPTRCIRASLVAKRPSAATGHLMSYQHISRTLRTRSERAGFASASALLPWF